MSFITREATRNRILAAIPSNEFAKIAPHLAPTRIKSGHVVHPAGQPITQLHFVEHGFISVLTLLSDGRPLEVGLVGCDGVEGAGVIAGANAAYGEAICQTDVETLRIAATLFCELAPALPNLQRSLRAYLQARGNEVMQIAACNAHHSANAKIARWLLTAADRTDQQELPFTHEHIAWTHGVRRSTVTIEAGRLQRAGAIRYRHGAIAIVDRDQLEHMACECYATIRIERQRLLQAVAVSAATPHFGT